MSVVDVVSDKTRGTITAKGDLSSLRCELRLSTLSEWRKEKLLPKFGVYFRYNDTPGGFAMPARGDEEHGLVLLDSVLKQLAGECKTPDRNDQEELYEFFKKRAAVKIQMLEVGKDRSEGCER